MRAARAPLRSAPSAARIGSCGPSGTDAGVGSAHRRHAAGSTRGSRRARDRARFAGARGRAGRRARAASPGARTGRLRRPDPASTATRPTARPSGASRRPRRLVRPSRASSIGVVDDVVGVVLRRAQQLGRVAGAVARERVAGAVGKHDGIEREHGGLAQPQDPELALRRERVGEGERVDPTGSRARATDRRARRR